MYFDVSTESVNLSNGLKLLNQNLLPPIIHQLLWSKPPGKVYLFIVKRQFPEIRQFPENRHLCDTYQQTLATRRTLPDNTAKYGFLPNTINIKHNNMHCDSFDYMYM